MRLGWAAFFSFSMRFVRFSAGDFDARLRCQGQKPVVLQAVKPILPRRVREH